MTKDISKISKRIIAITVIVKLLKMPIQIFTAIFISKITTYAVDGNTQKVLQNIIIIAILIFINYIINGLVDIKYENKKYMVIKKIRMTVYANMLNQKMHKLYNVDPVKSLQVLDTDLKNVIETITVIKPNFYTALVTTLVYTIIILSKSKVAMLFLLVLSLIQLLTPFIIKKYMVQNYERTFDIESQITEYILAGYKGISTIKTYGIKEWYLDKLENLNKKYLKVGSKSEIIATFEEILSLTMQNTLNYGVYIGIGILLIYNILELDVAIQIIALSGKFLYCVKDMFDIIPTLAVNNISSKKIAKLYNEAYEDDDNTSTIKESVELKDINYSLDKRLILKNLCLKLSLNQVTIIKGDNGTGKSTIFRVLSGLINIDSGNIYVDNKKVEKIKNYDIFYALQDRVDLDITLFELISLIGEKYTKNALNIAEKFNLQKDKIYKDSLWELSGGENRKAILCVAFALDCKILLLDEPTNYLDDNSNKVLKELVKKSTKGIVIVSHNDLFDDIASNTYIMRGA